MQNSIRYMLQLALADFLFLAVIPFQVTENINMRWIFPEWMCKVKETILFFNYYASVILLMVRARLFADLHMIKLACLTTTAY